MRAAKKMAAIGPSRLDPSPRPAQPPGRMAG